MAHPTRLARLAAALVALHSAGTCVAAPERPAAELVEREGDVAVQTPGADWQRAPLGQAFALEDSVRTRELSRALLSLQDLTAVRLGEKTLTTIEKLSRVERTTHLSMPRGRAYYLNRAARADIRLRTPATENQLVGTELAVEVEDDGRTTITVFEGEVEMRNLAGRLILRSQEQGIAAVGQAPRKTAVLVARNIIQWCLYYPAVLDLAELPLHERETQHLRESLAAYRAGDLLAALDRHPDISHSTGSPGARVYRAAVLLSVGAVEKAHAALSGVASTHPGRQALEQIIAAVNFTEWTRRGEPGSAGEWMAESYYRQSRGQLEGALEAARHAVAVAPEFGYARVRLAELEFSFGRTRPAVRELERGLALTPRNAQAHALQGFLLSAENRYAAARASFDTATALDGALGNAWLGRGLCAIRLGDAARGRADLLAAATLEPNRSLLRSYLGKAFSQTGQPADAVRELQRATALDPYDPTPWLYSALEHQQQYRFNDAIADLEKSIALNDRRRLYRSRFLLDQDLSVRNANLAAIYRNNGMTDLAVREATRAVENDYTNASAHLFLAHSFDALRDPTRITLRYETAWFNELLLAHLLAPVGGGPLSQFISQQEYSKLLQADGLGLSLTPEWRSDGRLRELASFSGTYGRLSFGLDFAYYYDPGHRPNNAFSREELYWQVKYQVTPDDIFYTFGQWQDNEGGDLFQSYFDRPGSLGVDFEEKQEPGQLLVGWNHRWAPGVHTLLLGGRLAAEQLLTDPATPQLLIDRPGRPALARFFRDLDPNAKPKPIATNPDGSLTYSQAFLAGLAPFTGRGRAAGTFEDGFSFATLRQFEIYSGEIQHLWETERHTLIAGGRWQKGEFETDTRLTLLLPDRQFLLARPAAEQHVSVDFERQSLYLYEYLRPAPWLTLIGGCTWDHLEHPENFRNPPVSQRTETTERWSGKAGFTLAPARWLTLRGAYTEAIGGVTFEESVRLEPVQLAGFNQSFRSLISESLTGSVEAPRYRQWGLSLEGQLPTRTWWAVTANVIEEDVRRTVGAFDGFSSNVFPNNSGYVPGGTTQHLDYREEVLSATVNQLLGRDWALGASYRGTRAELHDTLPQLRRLLPRARRVDDAVLHEAALFAHWNSPTGLFARAEAHWYAQDLVTTVSGASTRRLPGDRFTQFDVQAGYRFRRNLGEISVAVLNLTDTDYRLSPLTYTAEIPRERTFVVRCRLSF